MTLPEAKVFSNRYEIEREIARGGMANVYLARDQLLDRPVALKVLFAEFARDPSFVKRFRQEATAAANLNHPNIVGIYDWGEQDDTYFIVMEYVEGKSVRDLINEKGKLSAEEAASIGVDIAAALQFAHEHGVVHRDVKPGNVLVTKKGQVKVTDFGIARAGTSEALTQTGSVMGTATYFSPEQAQGLNTDGRSDVYSLGVVLYEMVCGRPPFSGDSPVSVAYKHVKEAPTPPKEINPDIPEDFERVILQAMTKSIEARYQNAEELGEDLMRFARGRPIAAAPLTALLTEAVDMNATVASPTVSRTQAQPAVSRDGGEPPARSRRRLLIPLFFIVVGLGLLAYFLAQQLDGLGGESVRVPNVVGLTREDAQNRLDDAGFKVTEELVANDEVPEDEVFGQDPEANTKLRKGRTVTIKVSTGPGQQEIPELEGQAQADAILALEDLGLEVEVIEEASEDVEEGLVIRTEPNAGTKVDRGSTVQLIVSSGPPGVRVPDVTNLNQTTASNQLGQAGFDVEVVEEASSTVDEGRVIRTEPAAGTEAPKSSRVKLVVSSGPEQVTLPNVVGSTQASATSTLQGLGLNVTVVTASSSDANDGKVITMNPSPGTKVDKGSTVTITVGQGSSSTTS